MLDLPLRPRGAFQVFAHQRHWPRVGKVERERFHMRLR